MSLSAKGGNYKLGAPGNATCLGDGVAIGLCARALGCNAIDIGCCSCVACNSAGAVAIGQGAHIEAANCAVAFGPQSGTHGGVMSVAIGAHIRVNGECGISIGGHSCADCWGGITIGPCACSINQRALAIGARAVAGAPYSIAIGSGVTEQEELNSANQQATCHCCTCACGSGSLAIGYGTYTECGANDSLALMPYAHTTSRDAIAIGTYACTGDAAALAIGSGACALAPASIAIGSCRYTSTCEGEGSGERETIGACTKGTQAIAIGSGAYALCNASIAIGAHIRVNGECGISIGGHSCADCWGGITIGPCACSIDQRALAIGARAVAGAPYSIAIGSGVTEQEELNSANQQATCHCCTCACGSGSLAIGYGTYTECGANDSLALMPYAHTTSRDAIAIGTYACTGDAAALAIGSGACALAPASIAIGSCRYTSTCEGEGSGERETIGACTEGTQAIAIGSGAYALCNASIAIGVCSISKGGISIGCCVTVTEDNRDTIVIGNCSMAGCGCANIVIGCHSCACGFHISCWCCGDVTGKACVCNDQSIVIGNEARSYPLGGGVTIGYGSQTSSLRGVTLGPGNSNHGLDTAYHTCCADEYCYWGPVHTLCFVSSTGVNASCVDMCGSIGNAQDTTVVGNGIAMTAFRSMAIGDWSVIAGHCSVAVGSHMGIGYWHNCGNKRRYECYLGDNPRCFGRVSLLGGYGHCIRTMGCNITVVGGSSVNTCGCVCNLFIAQSVSTCICCACNGGGMFLHCPSISNFNCLFIIDACVCSCTYSGSDIRDKTNLTELDIGLDFVNSLCAYEGNWNKREKSRLHHLRKFDSEIKAYQCYIGEDLNEEDEFNQRNPNYIEIDGVQEAEAASVRAALPAVAADEDEVAREVRKNEYRDKIKEVREKKAKYEAETIVADSKLAEPRKSTFLVADNVKEVLDKFGKDYTFYNDSEDDRPGEKIPSKSLVYSDFIPVLVKAIQELSAKVDKLERKEIKEEDAEEEGAEEEETEEEGAEEAEEKEPEATEESEEVQKEESEEKEK